jgi:hypothetical protein
MLPWRFYATTVLQRADLKKGEEPWSVPMFCSECGQSATGKFCASCGTALQKVALPNLKIIPAELQAEAMLQDWATSIDCHAIIAVPAVRDRIKASASRAKTRMSGEKFLEICDGFLSPLTGGVPFTAIAQLSQPISERLGLKTSKSRTQFFPQPPGRVLVAVLCSLAENGQQLGNIIQAADSCTLEAALPSDIWSLRGDLRVCIRPANDGTSVEVETLIPGQIYDWGKSKRALDRLFDDATQLARAA